MAKDSAILFIDDDTEDQDVAKQAFQELGVKNRIDCVRTGEEAIDYLNAKEPPFLIFCDYKLPRMDGIDLRKHIEGDEKLRRKAIPFIYLSTVVTKKMVEEVFGMNVQGLFEKGTDYEQIKALLKQIFNYWQVCKHPNN